MANPDIKNPNAIYGATIGTPVTTSLVAVLSNSANSNKVLKINSVYCANVDGSNSADIDLTIFNGTTDSYLAKTITVPADATQILVGKDAYIYLEEGKSLRARASALSRLELVISYEELS